MIDELPSEYEKVGRLAGLAESALSRDRDVAQKALKVAMSVATGRGQSEYVDKQRQLIDLAYHMDPELAASFVGLIDDDPARKTDMQFIERQIQIHEYTTKLLNLPRRGPFEQQDSDDVLARAAWRSLASLNANRATPVSLKNMTKFLARASAMPLGASYPIIAWILENSIQKCVLDSDQTNTLSPLFESLVLSVDLAYTIASNRAGKFADLARATGDGSDSTGIIISPGDHEKALGFIQGWLKEHYSDYLRIADPYFGINELAVLKAIQAVIPDCLIQVLTSSRAEHGPTRPHANAYLESWRRQISDQDPPDTDIIVVGVGETKHPDRKPFHDRYLLTSQCGLKLGGSFNGLGKTAEILISSLSDQDKAQHEIEFDKLFNRKLRDWDGARLFYESIRL